MLADTADRVEQNTPEEINRVRRQEIERRLRRYATYPKAIPARLAELDREWDIERAIEANAAVVALAGLGLAVFVSRRFLPLPFLVAGFLLQHAIQGWCPPVPILRRLGFRTATEIGKERHGLKMLRGDRPPAAAAPTGITGPAELHEGV